VVLTEPRQLAIFAAFLLISVALALIVSRRRVKYATTISPLGASRRVSGSEAVQTSTRFGPIPQLALFFGSYVLFGWIFEFAISDAFQPFRPVDRLLET
jgi:hypothetical protein